MNFVEEDYFDYVQQLNEDSNYIKFKYTLFIETQMEQNKLDAFREFFQELSSKFITHLIRTYRPRWWYPQCHKVQYFPCKVSDLKNERQISKV